MKDGDSDVDSEREKVRVWENVLVGVGGGVSV